MKMVCKKLLSLVLVALMLVSAVPFQASAAVAGAGRTVYVFYNDTEYVTAVLENGKITESDYTAIQEKLGGREVTGWYIDGGDESTFWLKGKEFSEEEFGEFTGLNIKPVFKEVTPPTTEHTQHTWNEGKIIKEATCTEDGLKEFSCTYSGCTATKEEKIPAKGHIYGDWKVTKEATCAVAGERSKTCTVCKSATETEPIPATGEHKFTDWYVKEAATADANGTEARDCTVCGKEETRPYGVKTKTITFKYTVDGETSSIEKNFVINKTMTLPDPALPSGYQFKGWFTERDGKGTQLSSGNTCTENLPGVYYAYITTVSKFPYSVYLHIYESGNVKTPLKTVTLDTWTCVKDGVVTLDELKDVVKTYYTAKTSDGIGYDGIYWSTSSTKTDYVNDKNKQARIDNLDELRKEGYVHLNVWIDNAKAKTDSGSSSSNPKTGDTIYMAVTVMGLSAASLAAVYYISKKRAVR